MSHKYHHLSMLIGVVFSLFFVLSTPAQSEESCPPGYVWDPRSGVGCKQANCDPEAIPNAHYSYESYCVCGSSGSIAENPADPNKECGLPADDPGCPSCIYACVHLDEDCPNPPPTGSDTDQNDDTNASSSNANADTLNANPTDSDQNSNAAENSNQDVDMQSASAPDLSTTLGAPVEPPTCEDTCNKYLRGKPNASVVSVEGTPPKCKCQIDVRDKDDRLTQTISTNGPIETTLTFDPNTGDLIKKTVFDRAAESERLRKILGYKYTEEEIDKLLAPDRIDQWFRDQTKNIITHTSILHPQFWWEHLVAVFDHGFSGNSADFVDVHNYGRCGDSMLWLERNLASQLSLGDNENEPGQKHEAFLSITGEKFSNTLNHTSLIIRPAGFTNTEWEDIVTELKARSGGLKGNPGITPRQLDNIDPRLLDAKVLDPYKKQITTVREFIKGWSYIRIS